MLIGLTRLGPRSDSRSMRTVRSVLSWAFCWSLVACTSSSDGASSTTGTAGSSGSTANTGVSVTLGTNSSGGISETATTGSTSDTTTTTTQGTTDPATTDDSGSTGTSTTAGSTGGSSSTGDTGEPPALGPGSMQFIGVNSDLPEGFALVALQDIPAGTVLRFSERAWNDNSGAFEVNEGTATLTLSGAVTAGTVFEVEVEIGSNLTITPDIGTIVSDGPGNWGIAGNGDNIFVYLGPDDDPTFIAGTAFSAGNVWTTSDVGLDGQSSMIPSTLSEAAGTITTFTADNVRYNGPRTGEGSIAAYLPLIADEANNYETGTAAYTPLAGTDFAP